VSLTPDNNGDISVDAAADIIHVLKGKENIEFFKLPMETEKSMPVDPTHWFKRLSPIMLLNSKRHISVCFEALLATPSPPFTSTSRA
jgi:hypothetical protein